MPERVGERLYRSRASEREAVQDEQQVQVPQGQLAVLVQQGPAHPAEMPPEQRPGISGHGRQRRFIGPRRTSRPPVRDQRPEELVDSQGFAVGGLLAPHPVHRLAIERVQGVDSPLPPSLEHVPIDPRHADRLPGGRIGIVLEPPWRRRERTVSPCSGRAVQHARNESDRRVGVLVGDGHIGALLRTSSEGAIRDTERPPLRRSAGSVAQGCVAVPPYRRGVKWLHRVQCGAGVLAVEPRHGRANRSGAERDGRPRHAGASRSSSCWRSAVRRC
jgi:hypothetical protein